MSSDINKMRSDTYINAIAWIYEGEKRKYQNEKNWKKFFLKGLSIWQQKTNMTSDEQYNIALLSKRIGCLYEARKAFMRLLKETEDPQLIYRARYHLGDIFSRQNIDKTAKKHFEECLLLNPFHLKARNWIKEQSESALDM